MGQIPIDLKNLTTITSHSNTAARTATVTATGIDIKDYIGNLLVFQNVGTVSGTSPTLDGKIQDSADNSAWADLSGATFTQVTASDSYQQINVDTRKARRYIRYVGTIAGTSPSFMLGVLLQGQKQVV